VWKTRVAPSPRTVFTAPADGAYRIVATSYLQHGAGTYTITVHQFAAKQN